VTAKREHGNGGRLAKAVASADGKPVWNTIMPAGTYHRRSFPNGVQTFDRAFFEKAIANWKHGGGNALPVDRFHWGDSSVKEVRAEDKKAVGWMEDFRISASGDLEALCNWNDDGREDITKDRLRYISPEWFWHYQDPLTGKDLGQVLTNASLLNDPFFTELKRMAASHNDPNQEHVMTREELIEMYGLKTDATDADIKAAAKKAAAALTASHEAEKAAKEKAEREGKAKLELEEKLAVETAAREASEKRIGELEKVQKETAAAALKKDAAALCLRLEREGRIIATQKEDVTEDVMTLGLAKATARWEKVPAKVQLRELGTGSDGGTETKESAHKKFMELVDAAQSEAKKAGEPLSVNAAYARVKASHPEVAKAAFSQN
jgi:phage I-like protein